MAKNGSSTLKENEMRLIAESLMATGGIIICIGLIFLSIGGMLYIMTLSET